MRNMLSISLGIVVTTEALADAFLLAFRAWPEVQVLLGRWEEQAPHDCFVTAGNSFGLMSAGIDAAVVARLGPELERMIQLRIMNEFLGEQPVGTAFLIETGAPQVPWLCHAPTMRVPGNIDGTDAVYQATRAALLAIYHHNQSSESKSQRVLMPAMGAGFGGVPARETARQMSAAWRLCNEPPYPPSWDRVLARERTIAWDGDQRKVLKG